MSGEKKQVSKTTTPHFTLDLTTHVYSTIHAWKQNFQFAIDENHRCPKFDTRKIRVIPVHRSTLLELILLRGTYISCVLMSGNDEEESDLEDGEEYVPSDAEENSDDEPNENDESSGDDDDVVNSSPDDMLILILERNKSEETEDERQQRLKSLFEDFIGGNDAKSKSSTSQAAPSSTADGKRLSTTMDEIPKLGAETADDIFGGIVDKEDVSLNNRLEPCERERKQSGLVQSEKRRALDGLTSAISVLSKKAKMSVLEKTAQDWGAFKTETGIQEELTSHNRGKQGYVDRVEFLSRTDYRQFEIERDARNAARKKK
uniref:Craniofacial development protein 1 n=1 Tax=Elaeophora elaphi TaxID=1147741 RepID=A0A0R3RGB2_9BILA